MMIEDLFFQDEGQVKITAAYVGISKLSWTAIREEDIKSDYHLMLMRENRFDHLPIESPNGTITEYFKTIEANKYDNVDRLKINYDDVIPLETNIRDVIEKLANQNRSFFFLRYQRNISGLITLGNLNCKQVQIYIFSLICELEKELGNFINSNLINQEIIEWIESKTVPSKTENKYNQLEKELGNFINSNLINQEFIEWIESKTVPSKTENKYNQILENYQKQKANNVDNQIIEHFYLVDFFKIIEDKKLFVELSYSKNDWDKLSSINELRKSIAHPTKSLIDNDNNIYRLQERIKKMEDLTFRLTTKSQNKKHLTI